MKEIGEVTGVKGNTVQLLFHRTSMCGKCGACGMVAGQDEITVAVKNTLDAQMGDKVEVEFAAGNVLKSSLIAYIFPLAMLFVGMWLGYVIPQNFFPEPDVFAAVLGAVFAFGTFLLFKALNPVFQKKLANVYKMVRIEAK